MKYSLKKNVILRDKKEIQSLFMTGKWKRSPYFYMVYTPTSEGKHFLFTTQKTIKRAFQRNRCRRILKEIVRLHQDCFPEGYNYGFIATVVPEKGSFHHYDHALKKMVERIP
ncbi:MAG: ribonuclease P protein component [Candidatus Marinimicrobia bacterium]|nr:ribonuclease P protein component [Candidatus Neomarinimicrobiota bacterium]MDD5582766.1 ribonuclease P protein component [Candidatus Neomarinimicrobiota bacterium]